MAALPRSPAIWSGANDTEPYFARPVHHHRGRRRGRRQIDPDAAPSCSIERAGIPARGTREPGGSLGGEAIRRLLLEGDGERWDAVGEALLLIAARHDHVTSLIEPSLAQGIWVVSDRFADSTLAYQGYGKGLALADLAALHRFALGAFAPDLTLILDLPAEIGLARAAARGIGTDRFERLDPAFHERLRQGFRKSLLTTERAAFCSTRQTIRKPSIALCSTRSSNGWE